MAWRAILVAVLLAAGSVGRAQEPRPLTPEALAARLAKVSGERLELIDREKDLLADAADGKLSRVSPAEAALLASGVRDAPARKEYLDHIDRLEKDARRAVGAASTPFDTGARLLRWLHAGPMAGGYSTLQDHLPALLDEGKFNCVSATVVYAVLGRRLGLDVRGVVVPAHVLAVQYDGTVSKDVETTSAGGFDGNKKYYVRREVGDLGLVAAVYRNTLARHNREGQYPEMIRAAVFAQSLDPKDGTPAEDVHKAFHNWWVSRARKDQFREALDVVALGLEAQPDNDRLRNARVDVYGLWARAHRRKGEWAAGAGLLADARTAHPGDRGLGREVERHYLLWSRADPDKAAGVLRDGLKALPDSYSLRTELARVTKKDK
jgi:hypothetical protein